MNRHELADKIMPFCEPAICCLKNENGFGWLYSVEQVAHAIAVWHEGTLSKVSFMTKNKKGATFSILNPFRLGVVPH
jgi:hypothetical protein